MAAMMSELVGAAFGFGPAIMYQICCQVFRIAGLKLSDDNLNSTIGNFVVLESLCGCVQLNLLRHHVNRRISLLLILSISLAMPPGMLLLLRLGHLVAMK